MTLDREALRAIIREYEPVLGRNLGAAYKEWMAGELARGAYEMVRHRHLSALAILDRDDLPVETAYLGAAMLTIDLRTGFKGKPEAPAKMRKWWAFFREAGFTEKHAIYDFPIQPPRAPAPDAPRLVLS